VAAAVAAGSGLAGPPARSAVAARPQAGYAPISTGPGMCLDDPGDGAGDGQPVQLWRCLGTGSRSGGPSPTGPSATRTAAASAPVPPRTATPPPRPAPRS